MVFQAIAAMGMSQAPAGFVPQNGEDKELQLGNLLNSGQKMSSSVAA